MFNRDLSSRIGGIMHISKGDGFHGAVPFFVSSYKKERGLVKTSPLFFSLSRGRKTTYVVI